MKPPVSNPNRDEIKKKAVIAKDALKKYLDGITYLRFDGFDKYGRVLGTLFQTKEDTVSVNQKMIDSGNGYVYNGGTKQT
jgi:endonuclease YncB( thermonuclease family)